MELGCNNLPLKDYISKYIGGVEKYVSSVKIKRNRLHSVYAIRIEFNDKM